MELREIKKKLCLIYLYSYFHIYSLMNILDACLCWKRFNGIHTWQKGGCFWPSDLVDDVVWRPSTMFGFGLLLRVLENWSFHSRARLWQNTISHLQLTFKVNTQANTSHSATKVKYAVLWYIPTTDPCSSSQGLSWRIRKSPKEILISQKLFT